MCELWRLRCRVLPLFHPSVHCVAFDLLVLSLLNGICYQTSCLVLSLGEEFWENTNHFLIVLELFSFLFYSETYLAKYDFLTNVLKIVKYYTFTHTKLLTISHCYPFNVSSHRGYVFLLIVNIEFLILYRYLLKWGLLSLFVFSSSEFYSLPSPIYIIVPVEDPPSCWWDYGEG